MASVLPAAFEQAEERRRTLDAPTATFELDGVGSDNEDDCVLPRDRLVTFERAEEIVVSEDDELPAIILSVDDRTFSLFAPSASVATERTLFGNEYTPVTINIPLINGNDRYNTAIFDSPLYFLVLELKNQLSIETDVIVGFPQLNLVIHQDLPVMRELSAFDAVSYHAQLEKHLGVTDLQPLRMTIVEVRFECADGSAQTVLTNSSIFFTA